MKRTDRKKHILDRILHQILSYRDWRGVSRKLKMSSAFYANDRSMYFIFLYKRRIYQNNVWLCRNLRVRGRGGNLRDVPIGSNPPPELRLEGNHEVSSDQHTSVLHRLADPWWSWPGFQSNPRTDSVFNPPENPDST